MIARSPLASQYRRRRRRRPRRRCRSRCAERSRRSRSRPRRCAARVDDDLERPVDAGAVRGRRSGRRPCGWSWPVASLPAVGEAEPHREHRDGEDDEDERRLRRRTGPGWLHDARGPADRRRVGSAAGRRLTNGSLDAVDASLGDARAERAGSVTAATIETATMIAEAQPIVGRSSGCRTYMSSPAIARTTVAPGETAPTDRRWRWPGRSPRGTGMPVSRFCRCRARIEQRVVDADAEADHDADDAGDRRHVGIAPDMTPMALVPMSSRRRGRPRSAGSIATSEPNAMAEHDDRDERCR